MLLPVPGRLERIFKAGFGFPAKHLVGLFGIGPHFLYVAGAAGRVCPVELHAGSLFESVDDLLGADPVARADVEHFEAVAVSVEHALHGLDMGLGQVYYIYVIADAGAIGRVVVVAEHLELLAYADGCLRNVGNEVHRHSGGHLADDGRRMRAYGIEVAEQDGLDVSTALDVIADYLLVDLLRVAVRALGRLDGRILRDGQVLRVGLAVDGATGREDDALHTVLRHKLKEVEQADNVVAVTDDIVAPTQILAGKDKKINIVKNTIDYKTILANSEQPIALDPTTKCSVEPEKFYEIMQSDAKKFINVGRYSPEKGHDRLIDAFYKLWQKDNSIYLIIMGGNSRAKKYEELIEKVNEMGLSENVILLLAVSNPYPIIKACDGFILSSLYEGFGLVLAEADILGLPIVSTDITGPRTFMHKYGGTLIENSDDGVYNGLQMLYSGEVKPLNVDYEAYNQECVAEFEKLFE